MLKYKLLLVVLLITVTPIFAQFKIGISGGAVLSSLVRDSQLNASAGMVGYLAGAVAKLNVGELGWFFKSGIKYTLEGDSDQNLNFIKIPLSIGLDFSEDVNIYLDYNLAWQVGSNNNVQEFYNDFANILGLGMEINLSEKIAIGSTLNYGLSNLVKVPEDAKNFNVKPFTFDIYLTYYIF